MNAPQQLFSRQHLWLATAAISGREEAGAAWSQWENSIGAWNESKIDTATYRLLPSVYKNLVAQKVDAPSLPRIKGIYKKNLIQNMRFLHASKPGLQALQEQVIPMLVFKGLHLALHVYKDKGTRSMSDIDLLVSDQHAEKAVKILLERKWLPVHVDNPFKTMQYQKSVDLYQPNGGAIDLHKRFLQENSLSPTEAVWERARPAMFDEIPILIPSSEDELLLACVHGWRWNIVSPIRWLVDAHTILTVQQNNFDWHYFVSEARKRKISFRTQKALSLLSEISPLVPQEIIQEIGMGGFESFEPGEEKWAVIPDGVIFRPRLFVIGYIHIREYGAPQSLKEWAALIRYIINERDIPFNRRFFSWVLEKIKNMARRYKLIRSNQ